MEEKWDGVVQKMKRKVESEETNDEWVTKGKAREQTELEKEWRGGRWEQETKTLPVSMEERKKQELVEKNKRISGSQT